MNLPNSSKPADDALKPRIIALLLFLVTAVIYFPVRNHDFITLDDEDYIIENAHVRNGITMQNVEWAFTRSHSGNWHPVTWISHTLDCQLWGLNPGPHHLVNVLFHCVNMMLLFLVLNGMTGRMWRCAFVAALFAWHPMHVESVAWASERKDVLSTFFWLLTMGAYARYVGQSKVHGPQSKVFYALALLCFALGLMSKAMLVTLPFVLLLLDFWPLQRFATHHSPPTFRRLIVEKIPFFALSGAASVVTFLVQRSSGAASSLQTVPIPLRVENAIVSYATYVLKMFWPVDLAVIYPYPNTIAAWKIIASASLLLAITVLAIKATRRFPFLAVGWFWFLGTLVPVIGLVQVGEQAMADRYTYVPFIGLFIAMVWGMAQLLEKFPSGRMIAACASAGALVALLFCTAAQLRYWRDSIVLFERALAVTPENAPAHHNLGLALWRQGKTDEALEHYSEAIGLNPLSAEAHSNLGVILAAQGKTGDAITQHEEALRLQPNSAKVRNNLANAMAAAGRTDDAVAQYEEALRLQPDFAEAHNNLGIALLRQGKLDAAIAEYQETLRLNPEAADTHFNLANALSQAGRLDEAASHYTQVLQLRPDDSAAQTSLAGLFAAAGRFDEAVARYTEALRLKPNSAEIHNNLGNVLQVQGKIADAVVHYEEALRLKPDLLQSLVNLGWIRAASENAAFRNGTEAVMLAQRSVELTATNDASTLDLLAAALAEAGRFDEAVETATKARELATAANQTQLADGIEQRRKSYAARSPYRIGK